jgi:hypothetical protein
MNTGPHSSQSHFFTSGKHERIENASPFMGVYSLFIHWISKGTLKKNLFSKCGKWTKKRKNEKEKK